MISIRILPGHTAISLKKMYRKLQVVSDEKWKLPRVRINYAIEEHWVNTFADITEGEELNQMAQWCIDNDCGYRTSYNEFKFRNTEQMTMFVLRWS